MVSNRSPFIAVRAYCRMAILRGDGLVKVWVWVYLRVSRSEKDNSHVGLGVSGCAHDFVARAHIRVNGLELSEAEAEEELVCLEGTLMSAQLGNAMEERDSQFPMSIQIASLENVKRCVSRIPPILIGRYPATTAESGLTGAKMLPNARRRALLLASSCSAIECGSCI